MNQKLKNISFMQPGITLLIALVVIAVALWKAGGDPLVLARIGTRFAMGDAQGTEGYDGQFVYYIALDPDPTRVAAHLDVPAYRYQRILLPITARILALGNPKLIPWALVLINIISLVVGTWAVASTLKLWQISQWYALVYGLWVGLLLALLVDLPEPLAFGLAAASFLVNEKGKRILSWILLGLALFAKEVTVVFLGALIIQYAAQRRWKDFAGSACIVGLPFLVFQAWLWRTFGHAGIGSGGAMATPFEWVPFMGVFRIGKHSIVYMLAMLTVFGPFVIFPSIWGMVNSIRAWLSGDTNWIGISLLLNSLTIALMPFSTFREPGGLLRYASGLVLAILLFAARYRRLRILNYTFLWLTLNVFLLK